MVLKFSTIDIRLIRDTAEDLNSLQNSLNNVQSLFFLYAFEFHYSNERVCNILQNSLTREVIRFSKKKKLERLFIARQQKNKGEPKEIIE